MESIIFALLIGVLVASAFFNVITWSFNWIAVGFLAVAWFVYLYNRFVRLTNRTEEAWSDIDVQLKRRYDLIPNLVDTVKGYAAHEASTFQKVTEARTKAMGAQTIGEHAAAENMLTGALKSLFAVSEAYPDLKANSNFVELQRELSDTENKIQAARRFYNSVVQELQNALEMFPSNIVGSMFGFKTREFFELAEGEQAARNPVKVSF
jgi:LemA protein